MYQNRQWAIGPLVTDEIGVVIFDLEVVDRNAFGVPLVDGADEVLAGTVGAGELVAGLQAFGVDKGVAADDPERMVVGGLEGLFRAVWGLECEDAEVIGRAAVDFDDTF